MSHGQLTALGTAVLAVVALLTFLGLNHSTGGNGTRATTTVSPDATSAVAAPTAFSVPARPGTMIDFRDGDANLRGELVDFKLMSAVGTVQAPENSKFALLSMRATNIGEAPVTVEDYIDFGLRDNRGRFFTTEFPDSLSAERAAEKELKRQARGVVLGPAASADLVFVILVANDSSSFALESCNIVFIRCSSKWR